MSNNSSEQLFQAPANGFRTFLIVWATQSISVFGSALTFFCITIWLTQVLYPKPEQKTLLAAAIAATSLVWTLANVFFAPIAGAWADRHDRKRTMLMMDYFNGFISSMLVLLIITHSLQLWSLLVLITLSAIVSAFHYSAFDTSYVMIVPHEMLPRANGMMQTMSSLSNILAPAIAATLISLPGLARLGNFSGGLGAFISKLSDGTPIAISIDAITFFFAATTLLFVFIPSPRRTDLQAADGKKKSLWEDVKEGAVYIWVRRPMLWLLGTFTMANLASSFLVLQPLLVKFNLNADWTSRGFTYETALALLTSVAGIGGVAGGVIISVWGGLKHHRIYGILAPMIVAGIAQAIFGFSPWLYVAAGACALIDSMIPIMNAHSQAIWQTQTPREMQGRVFAVRRLIAQCTVPLGTVLAGVFGGVFNPGIVVGALGILMALFCLAQFFNPRLIQVEDKAFLDNLAIEKASTE